MGVEYKHFLIPADASFIPKKGVIKSIDDVLKKWDLKTSSPKVYDLTNGINTIILESLNDLDFGHGVAIEYPGIDGVAAAKIMGSSYYGAEILDEDRYIQSFTFVVGLDFRIHSNSQELAVTVVKPPLENSIPIAPYCEYDELHYGLHCEAYSCSPSTIPPKVDIWVADKKRIIGGQSFSGFWRTAFIIDCGKDLPQLGDKLFRLENRQFIKDMETALGNDIIEIGEVY